MAKCTNESKATRMTILFGTGAIVGAGVALLFAPQSGRKTRNLVASKTNDLKELAANVMERGRHFVDHVKQQAWEAFEEGKEVARETLEDNSGHQNHHRRA